MMFLALVIAALAVACNGGSLNAEPPANGRIIGGQKATIQEYPYQVSLQILGLFHKCGGSIISEYYVLTAGHCVSSLIPNGQKYFLRIRAGTSYKNRGGSRHAIDKIIVHEKYRVTKSGTPVNDIALIRVKKPFIFDKTRKPVTLYSLKQLIPEGAPAVITGWGVTGTGILLPSQLRVVSVPVVNFKNCSAAYASMGGIEEGQICAGFLGLGGKDACQGDSGGPMVVNGQLAGITSYGQGCALPEYPGVYTSVAYYQDWIFKNANLSRV